MLMAIDNILDFQPQHTTGDIISCAQEVVTYITDHDNWEKPILPQEPGCDEMMFEPERFDWIFNKWDCKQTTNSKGTYFCQFCTMGWMNIIMIPLIMYRSGIQYSIF